MANVLDKMPKGVQPKAKAALHEIYGAETKAEAEKAFGLFVKTYQAMWTSPPMAGAGLRVYPALSYSAGDLYPSEECRRIRLKKTSMYSNKLVLASSLVANISPRVNSFFRLAKELSIGALSQQFARRLMLQTIPRPASRRW